MGRKTQHTCNRIDRCSQWERHEVYGEKGFCLYGNDINDSTSPIEAGLGWITKFTKEFVNSENLKKQKEEGVSRKLVAIELIDKGIARKDYLIVDVDGKEIGVITSGTMSPTLRWALGMWVI